MPIEKRTPPQDNDRKLMMGPTLAKVVSHIEPSYLGTLEVTLLKTQGNDITDETQTVSVRYAPPFYGVTGYSFQGSNADDFNDTQKSYGMWMIPPDVGVTVLCIFLDGNIADGYWIGCVPDKFANHMIPAIGASDSLAISAADKAKYDVKLLPVGEINRSVNSLKEGADTDKIKKPVHPFADRLLEQGTLEDDVRGVTTSTARRETPSSIFGISTPGPLDKRPGAKRAHVGKKDSKSNRPVPVSRLGGTQFVMDDGDARFQRKKSASDGPMEYADVLAGEKGDPTIPYSEYFRIRTRTGHQLLMHNSEDLIYIGNSKGTTWIELTSDGKIDIFATDSISIHTKQDMNFRADRDINLEAGRNVNIRAETSAVNVQAETQLSMMAKLDVGITAYGTMDIQSDGQIAIRSDANLEIKAASTLTITTGGEIGVGSGGNIIMKASSDIHMNGPSPATAAEARRVDQFSLNINPIVDTSIPWKSRYQSTDQLFSIMKRVPMHEPWPFHENFAPAEFKPEKTDRET
jgi:hypothetical protein